MIAKRGVTMVLNRASYSRMLLLLVGIAGMMAGGMGCAYENYQIIVGSYQVDGIAISDWRDVKSDGETITIRPGGRFAIRVRDQTQFLFQLDIAIRQGTGANFYTRTVSHEFTPDRGERFHYAVDGCTYRTADGRVIPLEYNADTSTEIIKLLIEAEQTEISVGCDRIYQGRSPLEATEYLIIEALEDSEIEIVGVNVFDIDEV